MSIPSVYFLVGGAYGAPLRGRSPLSRTVQITSFPSASLPAGGDVRRREDLTPRASATEASDKATLRPRPLNLRWLETVYTRVAAGDPDGAIDVLFEEVDNLLVDADFSAVDSVLRSIDPMRLDTNLIVAALSVTLRASPQLSARERFVQRAEQRLGEIAPDRVDRLLAGLI
jgi:hypothetical protein